MTTGNERTPFFVGYLATPADLKLFLVAVSAFLVGGFGALSLAIGVGQDDPGAGEFKWAWGTQTVSGRLEIRPYPILHVSKGTDHLPAGRTLLLSGVGKKGVQPRVLELAGKLVQLKGVALKRGDIDMLQVDDGKEAIVALEGAPPAVQTVGLGRWRLSGEICDGKCLAGAMRPGTGLSHRACANLCLIGGAPPVFVTREAVDGRTFFVLGDASGNPLSDAYLAHVAKLVSLEGVVERRGDLLVFKADLETLKVR
jgi:hypothetical protein